MATQEDKTLCVTGLCKKFSIQENRADNFKEAIVTFITGLRKRKSANQYNDYWALKNISFELKKGESIGIIGSNGAGKSTLLKILSNITEPTTGQVQIKGKVVSILEIGTGFHPDLTGAENIFLNGELMGMSESEIRKEYFDKIVEFSGVEDFIQTPVKHYSSGMYVRLAFSVAAHVNADLLILDEVLSVGDAEFRVKAKNKIKSLIQSGTSLLFVTHNMSEVLDLCNNCIWMAGGEIIMIGASPEVVQAYSENNLLYEQPAKNTRLKQAIKRNSETLNHIKEQIVSPQLQFKTTDCAPGDDLIRLLYASVSACGRLTGENIYTGNDIEIQIKITLLKDSDDPIFIGFSVVDSSGNRLFIASSQTITKENKFIQRKGLYNLTCVIKGPLLNEGIFSVGLGYHGKLIKHKLFQEGEIYFKVVADDITPYTGLICPPISWSLAG